MKRLSLSAGLVLGSLFLPFCATSAWREGFKGANKLQLVGHGHAKSDLPLVQRQAMAKEAAIMDALSHWAKFCAAQSSEEGVAQFRVENQKKRVVECDGPNCRALVVIELAKLRQKCGG